MNNHDVETLFPELKESPNLNWYLKGTTLTIVWYREGKKVKPINSWDLSDPKTDPKEIRKHIKSYQRHEAFSVVYHFTIGIAFTGTALFGLYKLSQVVFPI